MTTLATAPHQDSLLDSAGLTPSGLLRRRARQAPAALALLDPPNREDLTGSVQRQLSYGEADEAVEALAAHFVEIGLEPGDRVAVQLPNLIEAPLTLLGAWRAGLCVAAIPMLWRGTEIARICDLLEPAALIGTSIYGKGLPAELLRDVAATRLSVRFVLGFGPDLPDGVSSLDDAILDGADPNFVPAAATGPALVTFTARPGAPIVPVFRHDEDLLLQGAMSVMTLSLDRHDLVLNAYPLTSPTGIGMGLAPWLIGGAALIQHDPFDYDVFVQQVMETGATATALPCSVLERFADDGLFADSECRLRHLGRVWPVAKLAERISGEPPEDRGGFDVYPLGDLACLIESSETAAAPGTIPLGPIQVAEGMDVKDFFETDLTNGTESGPKDISVRGPLIPRGSIRGPLVRDAEGYVRTGLKGEKTGKRSERRILVRRDSELLYHGGFTIAASELDGLYQAFPDFLDAACFSLPDPVVGDRIFAAVVPAPSVTVSLEALHDFLNDRSIAPYKLPDKLLSVNDIPRDADGTVLRDEILRRI